LLPNLDADIRTQLVESFPPDVEVLETVLDEPELPVKLFRVSSCGDWSARSAIRANIAESEVKLSLLGAERPEDLPALMLQLSLHSGKVRINVCEVGVSGDEPDVVCGNEELPIHALRCVIGPAGRVYLRYPYIPADGRFR
jgi:hypothetical protein